MKLQTGLLICILCATLLNAFVASAVFNVLVDNLDLLKLYTQVIFQ